MKDIDRDRCRKRELYTCFTIRCTQKGGYRDVGMGGTYEPFRRKQGQGSSNPDLPRSANAIEAQSLGAKINKADGHFRDIKEEGPAIRRSLLWRGKIDEKIDEPKSEKKQTGTHVWTLNRD